MQIIKIIKALNYKANNYQKAIRLQRKGKSPKKKKSLLWYYQNIYLIKNSFLTKSNAKINNNNFFAVYIPMFLFISNTFHIFASFYI